MEEKQTLQESLKDVACGLSLLTRIESEQGIETVLVIKEETKYIKRLGYLPTFDCQIGLFKTDKVVLITTCILVNNDFNTLYETYFNYHNDNMDGIDIFLDLVKYDKLKIVYLNENGENVRNLSVNNPYKEIFTQSSKYFGTMKWSMGEFDLVKENVYKQFRSPQELYYHLKEKNMEG